MNLPFARKSLRSAARKVAGFAIVLFIVGMAGATFSATALAQDMTGQVERRASVVNATTPPELFSASYLAQVLGSLLLVFVCLFGVVYLLRRFNGVRVGQGSVLRVLGSANVGQREKIVLIEAGKEQLLLGVAQGSVRTLHVFDEPVVQMGEGEATSSDFAAILQAANPLGGRS